jgi:exodeoxyribonuclease V alpha subunit
VTELELSAADRALGRALGRGDPLVQRAIALTSHALGQGHVCLDLRSGDLLESLADLLPERADTADLIERLSRHPAVRVVTDAQARAKAWSQAVAEPQTTPTLRFDSPREARPIVLDASGRLFLARYYEHEQRLARAIARMLRVRTPTDVTIPARLTAGLDDDQARALGSVLAGGLTIVSGGPGTGKTSTVVRILAALFERAVEERRPFPRVLLLAPTGKAAARLSESIASAKRRLDAADEIKAALPEEGSTIHRALGVMPQSRTRFRHGLAHPLDVDVVIVDEASMVDLALMRHLAEALPQGASLVLLGDRDQLASVDAGNVLAELCDALEADPIRARGALCQLTHTHRFGSAGLSNLAAAARAGDLGRTRDVLDSDAAGVTFAVCSEPKEDRMLRALALGAFRRVTTASDAGAALARLAEFRILCAHRSGPYGATTLNDSVRELLVENRLAPDSREYYRGRPILITETDPVLDLHNGDVGVVWSTGDAAPKVVFERPGRQPLEVAPAHLPGHESAFAMTIHKSQGSEFDHVVVVLPPAQSPLATRELLYTAITRARSQVTLVGDPVALDVGLGRRTQRASGLGAAIALGLAASGAGESAPER